MLSDKILIENPGLSQWRNPDLPVFGGEERVPDGVTQGVPSDIYDEYRRGRDSACVDVILGTYTSQGVPAVLLSKRKPNVCYGGKWWMQGGALQAYQPVTAFAADRVGKECGVRPDPKSLILVGVYRTGSSDYIGSTLQPCYAAKVDHAEVSARMRTDAGHEEVCLFTSLGLNSIPAHERHWYPMRVAALVLKALLQ